MLKSEEYDNFCRFFAALRTGRVGFQERCRRAIIELDEESRVLMQQIKTVVMEKHQVTRGQFELLLELSKQAGREGCEEELFHSVSFADKHQTILQWFKSSRQLPIQDYVENTAKKAISQYNILSAKLENLFTIKEPLKNLKRQPRSDCANGITVQQILQLPKPILDRVLAEVANRGSLKEQEARKQAKRARRKRDKELQREVGEQFCAASHQLKFQYLPKKLREKLKTAKEYQQSLRSTLGATVKNIEMIVEKDFGFRRMTHQDRLSLNTDLKNYGLWMSRQEGELFLKAYRLFNELDATIEISPYQIFVLYVLIGNKLLENQRGKAEKQGEKGPIITQNESPKNLRKEITYLYYHYDSLKSVQERLLARYCCDPAVTPQAIELQLKALLSETYHRIAREHHLENRRYQRILANRKDYSSEPWLTIATNYVQYQIHSKLSDNAKDYLTKIMESIAIQHQPKPKSHPRIESQRSSKAEQLLLSLKKENRERKEKLIKETKVIKLEEQSSNDDS